MDADELSAELARSEYESLRHVSFSRHRLEEAERLGEDATFALGLIYLELGIDDIGEQLLELASNRAPEPWRTAAYSRLLDRYRDSERYEEAVHAAREPDRLASRLALLEALYELGRYDEVETLMIESGIQIDAIPATDPVAAESALWWAIARVELDRPDWPDAIRALYRDHPAAHAHSRVWVYLINRDELLDAFSAAEIDVFRAKQLLAEGRSADAADLFSGLAADQPQMDDYLAAPWGLLDVYRSGVGSGRASAAAEALRAVARRSEADVAARALEYAGRIYRLADAHAASIALLDESLDLLSPGAARQRVQWYRLSSRMRQDPLSFAEQLEVFVPLMSEPAYFADLLFELAGLLAERQRWDAMLDAYGAIVDFATPGTRARYELAIARAFELGLLAASPARAAELRELYLERAYAQRENLFAALVAGTLLGHDASDVIAVVDDPERPSDPEAPENIASPVELLVDTYFRFGLVEELYSVLQSAGDDIPTATRIRAAERIARAGRIRESIVALNLFAAPGLPMPRSVATMRYPLAFAAIMDRRIAEEGIESAVFYALIREESLFDPEIGSSAGATGLAQLMSSTAEDIARRMRLDDPDLLDPADSIAIGARYFSMLSTQFGTPARALAAYNAGQGNVRRWERRAPGLDEVLFHQTIPYPETYNHVRKVVVSAVYYGYLYEDRSPADTVRAIFTLD